MALIETFTIDVIDRRTKSVSILMCLQLIVYRQTTHRIDEGEEDRGQVMQLVKEQTGYCMMPNGCDV